MSQTTDACTAIPDSKLRRLPELMIASSELSVRAWLAGVALALIAGASIVPAHAAENLTAYGTSGMDRGQAGLARLQAQQTVTQQNLQAIAACGNGGRLYGPAFAGPKTGNCPSALTLQTAGGIAIAGGATISGNSVFNNNLTVTGTLAVGSTSTFANRITVSAGGIGVTGNSSVAGTFAVTGNATVSGTLTSSNRIYGDNGVHIRGEWLRVDGNNGVLFNTHNGGWHMSDATWIRAYNNKSIYSPQNIRAEGQFQIGATVFGPPPVCNASTQTLRWNDGWSCIAQTAGGSGTGEIDPTVPAHFKLAVPACNAANGQKLIYNGSAWVCSAETNPGVTAHGYVLPPACNASTQKLRWTGSTWECVADQQGLVATGQTYNIHDNWFRRMNDNNVVRLHGNTRQMIFRTDGTAGGVGAYPFSWTYGGDAAANQIMYINSAGRLWTKQHGWMDAAFQAAGTPASSVAWGNVSGKPDTATRWPAWSEVTGKPTTFAPSAHTHTWSQITGIPATATSWPTWAQVTGKPTTFAPSAHTHPWGDVTGKPAHTTATPATCTASQATRWTGSAWQCVTAGGISQADGDARYLRLSGGTLTGNLTAPAYYQSSDMRLKKDIRDIDNAISLLSALSGKSYVWRDSGKPAYGLIAQAVEEKFPHTVRTDAAGMKSVDYTQFIALLIEGIHELNARVDRLEARHAE